MKIRMHFPETEEGMAAFNDRLAEAHVQAIKYYIENLNCSPIQKMELYESVVESIRKRVMDS